MIDGLQKIGTVPFNLSELQSIYPDCKHITDKARRLEAEGRIMRLKRNLYVANMDDRTLSPELIANSLYGPSYVSLEWALSWHGLIPERVYVVSSLTTKHSRQFKTPLALFEYLNCSPDYFPLGIRLQGREKVHFMIASPEKALCDYIVYHHVNLRFVKEVEPFLEEDLRFDTDILPDLNLQLIEQCAETARLKAPLYTLLKYLQYERRV